MSLCASCGSELSDGTSLCRHHHLSLEVGWAQSNRMVCDLLHRGIQPARVPVPELESEPEAVAV
jgi:hypothetical protein